MNRPTIFLVATLTAYILMSCSSEQQIPAAAGLPIRIGIHYDEGPSDGKLTLHDLTGEEKWSIDGTDYDIYNTRILKFPNGDHLYVINVRFWNPGKQHEAIGRAIAREAYRRGRYAAALKQAPLIPKICVALCMPVPNNGYQGIRFQYPVQEHDFKTIQVVPDLPSNPLPH